MLNKKPSELIDLSCPYCKCEIIKPDDYKGRGWYICLECKKSYYKVFDK